MDKISRVYVAELFQKSDLRDMGKRPDRSCKKNKDIQKEAIKLCKKGVKDNFGVYDPGNEIADGDDKCNKVEFVDFTTE